MHPGLTEEELALLGHSELLAEEDPERERYEEQSDPAPAGFRERALLGDLSW
jgi:hypothetical protein